MSKPQGAPLEADFSRTRVLVLDPFIVTRRVLRDTFKDFGVSLVEACIDVRGAMAQIMQGQFTVLFTDWSTETDAPALIRKIRGPGSPNRFLPIVVMTAMNSIEHFKIVRDAGASEFMLKPFTTQVVKSRLASIVNNPRLYVETNGYFGPDRRRRSADPPGPDRRAPGQPRFADRRNETGSFNGPDRRQGRKKR